MHDSVTSIGPCTRLIRLFVLLLFFFGKAKMQKLPAWNTTSCTNNSESCRQHDLKEPRSCEYVCFENGTCKLNVAVILPQNVTYIVNMKKAVEILEEAEKDAKEQKLFDEHTDLEYFEMDDNCEQAYATINGLDAYAEHCAHFIVGSTCDYCTAAIGRIAKYLGYGTPVLTPGGFTYDFTKSKTSCADEYYIITNTGLVDYRSFGEFFHLLMDKYNWHKVALMYEKLDQNEVGGTNACKLLMESVMEDILLVDKLDYSDGDLRMSVLTYREHLKTVVGIKYGIILICASQENTRKIMIEAEKLNMMDQGEYVFFNTALYNDAPNATKPWYDPVDSDDNNEIARKAYQSLYTFSPLSETRQLESGDPFPKTRGQLYLDGVYDGLLLYAHAFKDVIENKNRSTNFTVSGVEIVSKMWGKTYQGRNDNVTINCNGLRTSSYALSQMNGSGLFHTVYEYHTVSKTMIPVRDIRWPRDEVPLDTPICGFDNSLCPSEINVFLIVISVTLGLGLIILSIFLYRHYKLESDIASMLWKVQWDDIIWLPHGKTRSSFYSMESLKGSHTTVIQSEAEGYSLAGDRQLYTTVAYYKGTRTAVKMLKDTKIVLNRAQLLELKVMKDLSNDHLAKFFGACVDSPGCCILTEYCPRGSLQDVLENEEVKLDWLFRMSLIQDLTRGMQYLHSSDVKSHGTLKSSNCVVDSRFVLKITDFGIYFLRVHSHDDSEDENSHSFWQRQLWTSPELLRTANPPMKGTQKGDVYSFAIIVHEIITRQGVFYLGEHNNNMTAKEKPNVEDSVPNDNVLANVTCDNGVLLPTLVVLLRGNDCQRPVRAVIDTGSQRSYILKRTAEEMKYHPVEQEAVVHSLFGGEKTSICMHNKFRIHIANLDDSYRCNFEAMDQVNICGNLPHVPKGTWMKELAGTNIIFSDVSEDAGPIEILIGANVAGKLYTGNRKELSCGLVAIETLLGWTIMGKVPTCTSTSNVAMVVTNMLVNDINIADFWKLELIGITDSSEKKTNMELHTEALRHFSKTVTVNSEGRYEVNMPWKEGHPPLPTNYGMALRRLSATVRKLKTDGCYDEYQQVLDEWLEEGVIERVWVTDEGGHYLPHRHVVKENSTTRIRPVFDASAHEKNSPALNDCLDKGLNLIEQIPQLLLRFRMKRIGVVSDIRRAFLQISLQQTDRDFLRFLWHDKEDNLIVFRHKRVVFGVVCSPFLLGAVIRHHLTSEKTKHQQHSSKYSLAIIDILLNSFYVDNLVTSLDNESDVKELISEASSLMNEVKFELRGWECTEMDSTQNNCCTNVLGLMWDRKHDTLGISDNCLKFSDTKVTKRIILSMAHKIFDPIGFTCPVTLCPKLLLREMWESKIGWDDEVDNQIRYKFLQWAEKLHHLHDVKIPRWLPKIIGPAEWTLHTFCDASESAYACAIFLRIESDSGVNVQLIQAKTRISPRKRVTIPRLELLAATIGARLYSSVVETLPEKCVPYFWTDSSTVLAWILREDKWATFVWNRVEEIRKKTKVDQWHHVLGAQNPADLPSRGCSGRQLLQSSWWEGPDWLRKTLDKWPSVESVFDEETIMKEKRKSVISSLLCTRKMPFQKDWYYRYFSKFEKINRMIAWIYRFLNNCRVFNVDHFMKKTGPLSVDEIKDAEMKVLKYIQEECFRGVTDKNIVCLQPFRDHGGVIRLKTKISHRPDSHDFRFPVLLPKGHPVVKLIIRQVHEHNCHVGVQGLLAILRERFWIMGGRKAIKSAIVSCVVCKRQQAKRFESPAIPLPVERVRDAAAFEVTGIDLAGPIFLKYRQKAWICLFTCAVVRAVHLELVVSLSTNEFLQALRRFVARRGRPSVIFSDCGSNFIGTCNAFSKVEWKKVLEYCSVERIIWKFNPPTASWWGGWWERLIGLMKHLLKRVLGRSSLNHIEMETILYDCESVLNSRPLTYISDNAPEPTPITTAMFIQDVRENGIPECDVLEASDLDKRAKRRYKLKEDLRSRFRNEYLGQLKQQAVKKKIDRIELGQVVLIGSDQNKRLDWPLAKVVELIPEKDGITRVVRLRTSSGEVLRPIQRLYPLLEAQDSLNSASEEKMILERISKQDIKARQPEVKTRSGRVINIPSKLLD